MQLNASKNLDQHKTFWDLQKDKAKYLILPLLLQEKKIVGFFHARIQNLIRKLPEQPESFDSIITDCNARSLM